MGHFVAIKMLPLAAVSSSDEAVAELACIFAAAHHLPVPSDKILRDGKPRFERGPHFSVSHSGDWWVCAVSGGPVGIDLQQHRRCRADAVARRFYHPDERRWLAEQPPAAFFNIWAAKEAYVKYTGEGITGLFSAFSTVDGEGSVRACNGTYLYPLSAPEGYSLCLCAAGDAEIEFI